GQRRAGDAGVGGRGRRDRTASRRDRTARGHRTRRRRDHRHIPGVRSRGLAERRKVGPMTGTYVQALALSLDPAWRRLAPRQRRRGAECFAGLSQSVASVRTFTYSMVGLQAGTDLLVWRMAPELDDLEE